MTVDRSGKARSRWRRLSLGLVFALAGGLSLIVPSGTASAVNQTCLNYPGSSYTLNFNNPYTDTDPLTGQTRFNRFRFPDGHDHSHVILTFWIHSATPTFNVAASTFVDNGTNDTQMGTFSTTQSRTFSISESVSTGVTNTFMQTTFSQTVSTTVTAAITTSTTITAGGPVPPHSRVNADFGVDAYIVNYDVAFWQYDQNTCWWHGTRTNVTANVPTSSQGWHLYPAVPL
jgi:hypothetical protein